MARSTRELTSKSRFSLAHEPSAALALHDRANDNDSNNGSVGRDPMPTIRHDPANSIFVNEFKEKFALDTTVIANVHPWDWTENAFDVANDRWKRKLALREINIGINEPSVPLQRSLVQLEGLLEYPEMLRHFSVISDHKQAWRRFCKDTQELIQALYFYVDIPCDHALTVVLSVMLETYYYVARATMKSGISQSFSRCEVPQLDPQALLPSEKVELADETVVFDPYDFFVAWHKVSEYQKCVQHILRHYRELFILGKYWEHKRSASDRNQHLAPNDTEARKRVQPYVEGGPCCWFRHGPQPVDEEDEDENAHNANRRNYNSNAKSKTTSSEYSDYPTKTLTKPRSGLGGTIAEEHTTTDKHTTEKHMTERQTPTRTTPEKTHTQSTKDMAPLLPPPFLSFLCNVERAIGNLEHISVPGEGFMETWAKWARAYRTIGHFFNVNTEVMRMGRLLAYGYFSQRNNAEDDRRHIGLMFAAGLAAAMKMMRIPVPTIHPTTWVCIMTLGWYPLSTILAMQADILSMSEFKVLSRDFNTTLSHPPCSANSPIENLEHPTEERCQFHLTTYESRKALYESKDIPDPWRMRFVSWLACQWYGADKPRLLKDEKENAANAAGNNPAVNFETDLFNTWHVADMDRNRADFLRRVNFNDNGTLADLDTSLCMSERVTHKMTSHRSSWLDERKKQRSPVNNERGRRSTTPKPKKSKIPICGKERRSPNALRPHIGQKHELADVTERQSLTESSRLDDSFFAEIAPVVAEANALTPVDRDDDTYSPDTRTYQQHKTSSFIKRNRAQL